MLVGVLIYAERLSGGEHRRGARTLVLDQVAEHAPRAIPTGERSGLLVLDVEAG